MYNPQFPLRIFFLFHWDLACQNSWYSNRTIGSACVLFTSNQRYKSGYLDSDFDWVCNLISVASVSHHSPLEETISCTKFKCDHKWLTTVYSTGVRQKTDLENLSVWSYEESLVPRCRWGPAIQGVFGKKHEFVGRCISMPTSLVNNPTSSLASRALIRKILPTAFGNFIM